MNMAHLISKQTQYSGRFLAWKSVKWVDERSRPRDWEAVERQTRPSSGGVDGVL